MSVAKKMDSKVKIELKEETETVEADDQSNGWQSENSEMFESLSSMYSIAIPIDSINRLFSEKLLDFVWANINQMNSEEMRKFVGAKLLENSMLRLDNIELKGAHTETKKELDKTKKSLEDLQKEYSRLKEKCRKTVVYLNKNVQKRRSDDDAQG